MDQAALARRRNHSRSIYVGDSSRLGCHAGFLGDIRNFLRRQPYEALLIRAPPVGLRASPQVKIAFLLIDFSEIHKSTSQTDENRHRGQISVYISALQKPSIKAACPEKRCQSCRQS